MSLSLSAHTPMPLSPSICRISMCLHQQRPHVKLQCLGPSHSSTRWSAIRIGAPVHPPDALRLGVALRHKELHIIFRCAAYEQRLPSYRSHLISEVELRGIMKQCVDDLDMTSLMGTVIERMKLCYPGHVDIIEESAPSDLEEMKSAMYRIARDMDLSVEMSLSCRLKSGFQALMEMRLHEQNCNKHILNGLALETEELLPSPLLQPLRTKLAQIVLQRLENASNVFANDMYREKFAALEAQLLFKEFNIPDSETNGLSSMYGISLTELAAEKAEGDRLRAAFFEKAELKQPQLLRLININASCLRGEVVLEDFRGKKYSAISHTYGSDVYEVFDCKCACLCLTKVPRCKRQICQPDSAAADESVARHRRVVQDILYMCRILRDAGVEFAWHDGVCIAQHNEKEVEETIKCMGWIYANATETIVFLHYVGKPMAPISNDPGQLTSRWHTRVWTVQEMALSKSRRYCVRVGDSSVRGCNNLREFEEKVGRIWNRVEVITEDRFILMVEEICAVLVPLVHKLAGNFKGEDTQLYNKAFKWMACMMTLSICLRTLGLGFPTRFIDVLRTCSVRESKHEGDRMNSLLALAGLRDFVAPKDEDVEEWTIKFFRMQGKQGLAVALFSINAFPPWIKLKEDHRHTWAPSLSHKFVDSKEDESWQDWNELEWTVDAESGGNLKLTGGPLVCVAIKFTLKTHEQSNWSESGLSALSFDDVQAVFAVNSPFINMELTRIWGLGRYGSSFAEAPHFFIGSTALQVVSTIPGPYPVVDEGLRRIREGDTFEAHLVLPLHTITMAFREHSDRPSSYHTLGLLVQGELPSVSKIGHFTPRNGFLLHLVRMLMLKSPSVTILDQLVIK